MDCAKPLLKRCRPHHCGAHHLGAGLDILAVAISARQVLFDQPHPFQRYALAHGMIMRAGKCLNAMGKSIKPGASGNGRRQTHRQLGVANHHCGQNLGMKDDFFDMGFCIGDHTGAADLGSGASGGWHRDNGRNGTAVGAGPPIANIFKIPHRPALGLHKGHHLAQIEARAAAKGNHPVMVALPIGRNPSVQVFLCWIWINLTKHSAAQPGGLHKV